MVRMRATGGRTSPIRKPARRPSHGFTLLEILVVLVIVGIMTTFAVLSLGGNSTESRMQTARDRMLQVFKLAGDEAIVRNLQLGVMVKEHSYRFVQLGNNRQWTPYTAALPLRTHHAKPGVYFQAFVDGLKSGSKPDIPGKKKNKRPQGVFLSSGEATPFTVEIHGDKLAMYYKITIGPNGDISTEQKGAQD